MTNIDLKLLLRIFLSGTRYDTWLMPHQECFEHHHVLDGLLAAVLYTYLGTVTSVAAMSRWT